MKESYTHTTPDRVNKFGDTVLHQALKKMFAGKASQEDIQHTWSLVNEYGGQGWLDIPNKYGETPLLWAVRTRDISLVSTVLKNHNGGTPVNPLQADQEGNTPWSEILTGVGKNKMAIIRLFDEHYGDELPYDWRDNHGNNLLHYCIVKARDSRALELQQFFTYLVEKGVDVNQANALNATVLGVAAYTLAQFSTKKADHKKRYVLAEVVTTLLRQHDKHRQRLSQRDVHGQTILHYLVQAQDLVLVKVLLGELYSEHLRQHALSSPSSHQAIDGHNDQGETPLITAVKTGNTDMVTLLLHQEHPANPHLSDSKGWQALHHATARGHYAIAKVLLQQGAYVGATTFEGETPRDLMERQPQQKKHSLRHSGKSKKDWQALLKRYQQPPLTTDVEKKTALLGWMCEDYYLMDTYSALLNRGSVDDRLAAAYQQYQGMYQGIYYHRSDLVAVYLSDAPTERLAPRRRPHSVLRLSRKKSHTALENPDVAPGWHAWLEKTQAPWQKELSAVNAAIHALEQHHQDLPAELEQLMHRHDVDVRSSLSDFIKRTHAFRIEKDTLVLGRHLYEQVLQRLANVRYLRKWLGSCGPYAIQHPEFRQAATLQMRDGFVPLPFEAANIEAYYRLIDACSVLMIPSSIVDAWGRETVLKNQGILKDLGQSIEAQSKQHDHDIPAKDYQWCFTLYDGLVDLYTALEGPSVEEKQPVEEAQKITSASAVVISIEKSKKAVNPHHLFSTSPTETAMNTDHTQDDSDQEAAGETCHK